MEAQRALWCGSVTPLGDLLTRFRKREIHKPWRPPFRPSSQVSHCAAARAHCLRLSCLAAAQQPLHSAWPRARTETSPAGTQSFTFRSKVSWYSSYFLLTHARHACLPACLPRPFRPSSTAILISSAGPSSP